MQHNSWASLLTHNLASPCLGHELKIRVATLGLKHILTNVVDCKKKKENKIPSEKYF
jgi:hypothetical protein